MKEEYTTTDLCLATTLIVLGFKITRLDRETESRARFVFDKTKKLDEAVTDFYLHKLEVEPLGFFGEMRMLKSRIYQEQGADSYHKPRKSYY
jgi:hypothetical protein